MPDTNRLELDIVAIDDTQAATKSAQANFKTTEEVAAASAAGVSRSYNASGISMAQSIDRSTASAIRSTEALERRAALAGKTGIERLQIQRDFAIRAAGTDEALIQRRVAAFERLMAIERAHKASMAEDAAVTTFSFRKMGFAAHEYALATRGGHGNIASRIAEGVEASKLAEPGHSSIFSGLGTIFSVGIGAGFAAHFIDELVKTNVELSHLGVTTGITVHALAGFNQVVKEQGGDVEKFDTGLVKMENSIQKARDAIAKGHGGSDKYVTAFRRLGLSTEDIQTLNPEQVIYKLAAGLQTAENSYIAVNAAQTIFTRNGAQSMIPVLAETGDKLREMVARAAALSGATDRVVDSSKKWIQQTEQLGQVFHLVGNVALTLLIPAIQTIMLTLSALGAVFVSVFDVIIAGVVSSVRGFQGLGSVIKDVVTGNWGAIAGDAAAALDNVSRVWSGAIKDIKGQFSGVGKDAKLFFGKVPESVEGKQKNKYGIPGEDEGDDEDSRKARKIKPDLTFGRDILDAQRERNRTELDLAKKQTDANFKAFEDGEKRKKDAQRSLITEGGRLETEARSRYFDVQNADNERARKLALSQLDFIDAQSIKEKIALEDQKLAIETAYTERSLQIQIRKIQSEKSLALGKLQGELNTAGPEGQAAYDAAAASVTSKANADIDEARRSAGDKELTQAQDVANKKAQLAISENRKIFDNLKQAAGGLFDALFEKSKSFADVLKGLFKTAILTPIKEIFSSQVAGLFTELLTGQKVSFNEVGSGQGRFGKVGSILGRLGLGTPRFGQPGDHPSNLDLPNHLGDAQLVSGAVPVVVVNGNDRTLAVEASGGGGIPGLPLSLSFLPQILGSVASHTKTAAAASAVSSKITYADGSTDFGPGTEGIAGQFGGLPGAPPYNPDRVGYDALDQPGGGGFFGKVGGFFGKIFGGGESGGIGSSNSGGFLKSLRGFFGGGSSPATSGLPDMGGPVPGATLPGAPALSGLKALQGSSAASLGAAIGFGFALDGIRRGGVLGTLEAAGGGAAVGFKLGGPIGAGIGAAVGAGAALIRTLFGDDVSHTKKLVRQIYGLHINDATAKQIIDIAKQKYGGAISVAVRSQEVRDLLKLYAQTLEPSKQGQFVNDKIHSASLIESNGRLYQGPVYDNGSAYAYQSPLSTYGGVNASPLPTSSRESGSVIIGHASLSLNGDNATSFLDGRVAKVANPGYIQSGSLSASRASNGRMDQTALTLGPSAITR